MPQILAVLAISAVPITVDEYRFLTLSCAKIFDVEAGLMSLSEDADASIAQYCLRQSEQRIRLVGLIGSCTKFGDGSWIQLPLEVGVNV